MMSLEAGSWEIGLSVICLRGGVVFMTVRAHHMARHALADATHRSLTAAHPCVCVCRL